MAMVLCQRRSGSFGVGLLEELAASVEGVMG